MLVRSILLGCTGGFVVGVIMRTIDESKNTENNIALAILALVFAVLYLAEQVHRAPPR